MIFLSLFTRKEKGSEREKRRKKDTRKGVRLRERGAARLSLSGGGGVLKYGRRRKAAKKTGKSEGDALAFLLYGRKYMILFSNAEAQEARKVPILLHFSYFRSRGQKIPKAHSRRGSPVFARKSKNEEKAKKIAPVMWARFWFIKAKRSFRFRAFGLLFPDKALCAVDGKLEPDGLPDEDEGNGKPGDGIIRDAVNERQ